MSLNKPYYIGKWNEYKGKAKEQWGKLTDDQLDEVEGKRDQLLGLIQQNYGMAREQAERDLSKWEESVGLR